MASARLIRLAYHMFNTRKVHSTANRMSSNWRDVMKKELKNGNSGKPEQTHHPVCIYRVPSNMRRVEPKAYRPNNISIGPCHHGAPHLRNMEALKKRFYRRLFNNDTNAAKLDEAFKFLEEQETNVRRCYNEDINLESDEFLQMMLVDGSFIVQLLRDLSACKFGKVSCLSPWMLPIIRREMIMLENQIPMFVLSKLFELTSVPSEPSLKDLALQFFYPLVQVDSEKADNIPEESEKADNIPEESEKADNIPEESEKADNTPEESEKADNIPEESEKADGLIELHFVDLLRSAIRKNLKGEEPRNFQPHMIRSETVLEESKKADKILEESKKADKLRGLHFLDLLRSGIRRNLKVEKPRKFQLHMIRSVTELIEAGVKIKAHKSKELLDISFGKKWGFLTRELTIPPLYINDHRGTVFRNIVAFENCHKDCNPDVTTYMFFFNGLINSARDVSLLHYKGVLHHSLGNDNTVSELINNVTKEIVLDRTESYLYEVVTEANSYFGSFYARKRASLVHHYLTSWVVGVSTVGALLALYFTFIQTVCSFADSFKAFENQSFESFFIDLFWIPVRGMGVSTIGALLDLIFTFIQTVCLFADSFFENQSFGSFFIDPFLDTSSWHSHQ